MFNQNVSGKGFHVSTTLYIRRWGYGLQEKVSTGRDVQRVSARRTQLFGCKEETKEAKQRQVGRRGPG